MYKKATANEDYEYFELEEPVKLINDKLYVIKEGIEIGTNCIIQYKSSNNQISVITLGYLVSYYANQYQNAVVVDEEANFNNKKGTVFSSLFSFASRPLFVPEFARFYHVLRT